MKIYLIRHAEQLKIEGDINTNENDQIRNEKIILSVKGEMQANEISKLSELQGIEEIWSSNYVRAIATAKYIAQNNEIPLNIDERLNERKLGNLEKLKKLGEGKRRTYTEEQLIYENLKNDNGECNLEVRQRMQSFIEDILAKKGIKKIAIISHGATIKFFLKQFCTLNDDIELEYKGTKLKVNAPSVFELDIHNKIIKKITQIW